MFIKLPRWVVTTIEKINVAWKIEYVEYNYNKTCEACSSKGLCNHCNCDKCALKIAYDRAVAEINMGLRKPIEKLQRGCYTANNLQKTQVLNCHINPREDAIMKMDSASTFEELKTTRLNYCAKCSKYPNCTNCTVKHTFESNIRRFI